MLVRGGYPPVVIYKRDRQKYFRLRRAAERGRLGAQRRSDQWYSTRKWVDEYRLAVQAAGACARSA
jgi:hypothetical protein